MKLQMKYWGLLAALLTMLPVPAAEAGAVQAEEFERG